MADLLHRVGGWVRIPGRRHLTTFASLTAATQAEAVFSFLGTVALVRVTGAETAGRVFFAQSLASVWFMFWDPRLEDAAQRFMPMHQATAPGHGTWLFVRLLRLDVIINVLVTMLGVAAVVFARSRGWATGDEAAFLTLATLGGGMAAAVGSARVGFAVSGQLGRLGLMRLATAAMSFALTIAALITGGPLAYLVAAALAALATTIVFAISGYRLVARTFGPPPTDPIPMPGGIGRFALKSSAAASLSAGSDSGVLTLAGFLAGPQLVTTLKIAGSAGRLLRSLVSTVSTQLYPRLASAAVLPGGTADIRRDILRASALLTILGTVVLVVAAPLAAPLLALTYGPPYAALATLSVVLLAASCIRGVTIWAKVLPLALGRPGLRLAFVASDGALVIIALLFAAGLCDSVENTALAFGWGSVGVAAAGAATWLALLRPLGMRS